jgi:hypothetical protein
LRKRRGRRNGPQAGSERRAPKKRAGLKARRLHMERHRRTGDIRIVCGHGRGSAIAPRPRSIKLNRKKREEAGMRGGAQCIAPCKGERQEDECGNADAPAGRPSANLRASQRYGRAATIGSVVLEVYAGRGPSRLRMNKPRPVQG